ncbi:MAG: hypothetical protein A3J83_05740 [Elusimicrobia bacterium RIFOXYA2_FULL_40_6]|nr:MAG: hypothetical protein A3J83_05740 [Elusimicrobia bacterium RIFOXYA2_FULL_40_6]
MDFKNNLLDYYKELYYYEIDRKNSLESSFFYRVTIITLLFSTIVFILNNLPICEQSNIYLVIFFWTALCICGIASLISLFFLIKSQYNYGYIQIPTSEEIENYRKKIVDYNNNPNTKCKIDFQKDLEDLLSQEYSKSTHVNATNNDKKSKYMHKMSTGLIFAIIFLLISAIPFFILKSRKPDNIYKILIMKEEGIMPGNKEEQKPQSIPQTQKPQDLPQKPERPQGRIIKEGDLKEIIKDKTK